MTTELKYDPARAEVSPPRNEGDRSAGSAGGAGVNAGGATPVGGSVVPAASESFINSAGVQDVTERALTYLACGYAVHLAGPSGTGKTTLAFHIAAQLGRPVSLIHGNDEFGSSDLVGRDSGYRKSTLVDNYVRSVLKTEENVQVHWMDNRLTVACEHGHTLIYDEFNRSRPETNNILLSILEEGILSVPRAGGNGGYLKVNPNFRAIFTSNPEEYAGVHGTQDALLDRLVTIEVEHHDRDTECAITKAKSGLDSEEVQLIVDTSRALRSMGSGHRPTVRSCIALAKAVAARDARAHPDDAFFARAAWDIFGRVFSGVAEARATWNQAFLDRIMREAAETIRTGQAFQLAPGFRWEVTPPMRARRVSERN
ncbi:MAG: gas vesicle protein GvpN [Planctomycetota bacterium]|nr:gas vesicle protein GvpN [Planctomycetota bacterium]